jgi:hypothetical protein
MTYMRSWKSHRLTSHTWLSLNPLIGRPLSRIVGAIGLFFYEGTILFFKKHKKTGANNNTQTKNTCTLCGIKYKAVFKKNTVFLKKI